MQRDTGAGNSPRHDPKPPRFRVVLSSGEDQTILEHKSAVSGVIERRLARAPRPRHAGLRISELRDGRETVEQAIYESLELPLPGAAALAGPLAAQIL